MEVAERLAALDEAIVLGDGRLPDAELAEAHDVAAKARERLAQGAAAVVVALAGGTGSGKSSLFNALAGRDVASVGARRPVTTEVTAWATGDPETAGRLLDWLGVARRHHDPDAEPRGLVLLDLPDHDSVALDHRLTSDHFVERVDVLVWVVDPLKYAQRALHDDYLTRLAAHAEVTLVVLNRADELTPAQAEAVRADLRRLLDAEGLNAARVVVTSAAAGTGLDTLRKELDREVRRRTAMAGRLTADVRTVAATLRGHAGQAQPADLDPQPLVAALADAAGVDALASTAAAEHRADARAATRPALTRVLWAVLSAVAIGPLKRLRPREWRRPAGTRTPRAALGTAPPAVRRALLDLADTAAGVTAREGARRAAASHPQRSLAGGQPGRVLDATDGEAASRASALRRTRDVAAAGQDALLRATGRALDGAVPADRRRAWWAVVAALWTVVELVAVTGLGWLVVLGVLGWLQLPSPAPPDALGELPWPTALLLGGALAWLLIGALRTRLVKVAGRRRSRRVRKALRNAVADAAEQHAIAPLRAEVSAQADLRSALDRAAR